MPSDRRDPVAALLVGPAGEEGVTYGVFYGGTVFRGGIEAFEWIADADDDTRATVRLLQDDQRRELTLERCEPDPKFDACMLLRGDPRGVERYQSRRRWGGRGVSSASAPAELVRTFDAIVAADPELAASLGQG